MIRSATLQRTAEIVMVLGIVFLCQPWIFFLHRYGLTVIIVGLLTFMFTGWFGSKGNATASEPDSNAAFDVSDHRKGHS